MHPKLDLSICIVNWNTKDLLKQCLTSIYGNSGIGRFEVLVVDNNSSDGSPEMVKKEFKDVMLIENYENVGFARANNQMLRIAKGTYALLLNSDTIVLKNSLAMMLEFMEANRRAGACGPKLLNKDLSYQRSFMNFPTFSYELRYHLRYHFAPFSQFFKNIIDYKSTILNQSRIEYPRRVNVIPGAAFFVRMQAYRDIGPMCEDYFLYSEENDWCWRMRERGWLVYYVPHAKIIHLGGASTSKAPSLASQYHFYRSRYKFFLKNKPAVWIVTYRFMNLFFWCWYLCTRSLIATVSNKSGVVTRTQTEKQLAMRMIRLYLPSY